jgi:hypothetical protein
MSVNSGRREPLIPVKPPTPRLVDEPDPDGELGPAMRALSPQRRAAVRALFKTKGNRSAAARLAGYKGTPRNLASHASRIFAQPGMRAAIKEECARHIDISEPELIEVTMGILRDKKEKAADRLRAIGMVWDRANPVMTKHKIEVEHHLTSDERDIQHYLALKKLGAPHDAFLRRFGANGLARVEALVLAEEARRRQIEGKIIETEYERIEE